MKHRAKLHELAWLQVLLLGTAAAVAAILWASNIRPEALIILIYSVVMGNFVSLTVMACTPLIERLQFPKDWILFLSLLLLITPFGVAFATAIIYYGLFKLHGGFFAFFVAGWKFPSIVTVIFGIVFHLYRQTKERLEFRNRELERVVEVEAIERESHDRELQRAQEIQQALLPTVIPQIDGFELAAAWKPARLVGGDYYDVIDLGRGKLAICIADVVGKSISAALLMASVQASVRAFATQTARPAEVCDRINKVLCNNIASDKFVTLFFGILEENGIFEYCNAGHLPPILANTEGVASALKGGGLVLGILPTASYQNCRIRLESGDRLLLFTDGITEAERVNHEEFGDDRVMQVARKHCERSAAELKAVLMEEVDRFCDSHLRDDATLIVVAALEKIGADRRREREPGSSSRL